MPAMSSKRLDAINDYSRHGYMLQVECLACRRIVVIDPWQIVQLCQHRQWSRQMAVIEHRLRCATCGGRAIRLGPAFGKCS